jgi:hypothetical protein
VCGPVQANGILCRGPTQAHRIAPPLHPAADPGVGNQLCWPLLEWREETHSLRCRPAQSAALHCSESQPAMSASRPAARHLANLTSIIISIS